MAMQPFSWNAVVIGYWNLAILTPAGIAKYLFKIEQSVPLHVEVPLDRIAPHRIKHDEVVVVPSDSQIIIEAEKCDYDVLQKAKIIGANALKALKQTPVSAAGFNIRYKFDILPRPLAGIATSSLDNALSDNGYEIAGRELRRSLVFRQGTLNIAIMLGKEGTAEIALNFDRQSSNSEDLVAWLELPIEDVRTEVSKILSLLVGPETQEQQNV